MDVGDARLVFGNTTSPTDQPKVRTWDGSAGSWSASSGTIATNTTIQYIVNDVRPVDATEEIVGVLSKVAASGSDLDILRLAGGTWSVEWSSTAITNANANKRGFDLAHEALTGRTVVVYSNNTSNPQFRMWDGTSWTGAASVFGTPPGTGVVLWVELVSRPGTDEIALTYVDSNNDLFGLIWDGAQWVAASIATLELNVKRNPISDRKSVV